MENERTQQIFDQLIDSIKVGPPTTDGNHKRWDRDLKNRRYNKYELPLLDGIPITPDSITARELDDISKPEAITVFGVPSHLEKEITLSFISGPRQNLRLRQVTIDGNTAPTYILSLERYNQGKSVVDWEEVIFQSEYNDKKLSVQDPASLDSKKTLFFDFSTIVLSGIRQTTFETIDNTDPLLKLKKELKKTEAEGIELEIQDNNSQLGIVIIDQTLPPELKVELANFIIKSADNYLNYIRRQGLNDPERIIYDLLSKPPSTYGYGMGNESQRALNGMVNSIEDPKTKDLIFHGDYKNLIKQDGQFTGDFRNDVIRSVPLGILLDKIATRHEADTYPAYNALRNYLELMLTTVGFETTKNICKQLVELNKI
jgi:hypothetical protein